MDTQMVNYYALTTTSQAIIHSPQDLNIDTTAQLLLAIPTQVPFYVTIVLKMKSNQGNY